MHWTMHNLGWLLLSLVFTSAPAAAADSLETIDLAELKRYLAELQMGRPGSAALTDRLAEIPFTGLLQVIQTYVDLQTPIEPHTHRAFQALLDRNTRDAEIPWPLVTLYAPDLARFLTEPLDDNALSQRLFDRLRSSHGDRQSYDLAVRLAPAASLQYLASGKQPGRLALLDAWNRRLARSQERRPIPNLADHVSQISARCSIDLPAEELEPLLRFVAFWPKQREGYQACLRKCLEDKRDSVVMAGLAVQHRAPLLLELNAALVERFAEQSKLVERAVLNHVFDDKHDHSATLRRLWGHLPASDARARRACLFAMGEHPRGNDAIALSAVRERSYDFLDVAIPVLKAGDPAKARQAIAHVLTREERGHEEVLRLARELELRGFEEAAAGIAGDVKRESIVRQTALSYLQLADGMTRRRFLPLLADRDADLRLAAIRMFLDKRRLTETDLNEIGPALIRVAQSDRSHGHRQEAIYVLGSWREPSAAEFLQKVLKDHPRLPAGPMDDTRYWDYRLRLVALLGLARLDHQAARRELHEMHRSGGPGQRMDVLLAFVEIGEAPEFAFEDLSAAEPKLVATAVHLIARHGNPSARARVKKFFTEAPLWSEFLGSGIDDHNILRLAEVTRAP